MKHAFVCYVEHHRAEDGGTQTCVMMARGEAAESHEAFISWHAAGVPVTIISWFEVPQDWKNAVSEGSISDAFEALLGLDALSDTPLVSDLLATIFAAGFKCGEKHHRVVQSAFERGRVASGK